MWLTDGQTDRRTDGQTDGGHTIIRPKFYFGRIKIKKVLKKSNFIANSYVNFISRLDNLTEL